MIKLYGISASRAFRPMWLMEEIDLEYELIPIDFRKGENCTKDYLAINPNGKVPTLIDGDLVLYDSMALDLYLAKKYGNDLYPDNPEHEALANMWSYWVMTEVEHSLLTVLLNTRILPEEQRKPDRVERNRLALEKPFTVLNDALEEKTYLIEEAFSIADLNVASVISWCRPARVNLKPWPNMKNWLERCISRPAFKIATKK